jgi:hypothetical protein
VTQSPDPNAVHADGSGTFIEEEHEPMTLSHPQPEVLAAMHALFRALGKPYRDPITEGATAIAVGDSDATALDFLHPVFPLAETFAPGDAGYTSNTLSRGGHLSLPCFGEDGDIVVLETSFYKGITALEKLTFPREQSEVHAALRELLQQFEVRG